MSQENLTTNNQLEAVFFENFDFPKNTRVTLGKREIIIENLQETDMGQVGKLQSQVFIKNLGDEVNIQIDEEELPKHIQPNRNDYHNETDRERLIVLGELMKKPIKLHEIVSEFI